MQFNSYEFILLFLPLTVLLYFLANKYKPVLGKIVIILSSIIFYSVGRANMLFFLGISILINYGCILCARRFAIKSRYIFFLPVIVNIGFLLYFKYSNFAISNLNLFLGTNYQLMNISLPLGISFYTFQQIAYVVEIENGELKNNSFVDYLVYILFFPKLIMGPIIDPVDFLSQINEDARKKFDVTSLAVGIKLFSWGLIKKVILADTFSKAVSWIYDNLDSVTPTDCVLLILFYTFEIYYDFSGYSDMAIGISSMLNIELPMNFDSPYKAVSIRDFWKRWHISLTKFLTKYIYIPLGGSRKGKVFTYVNTMIVFLVSGLWHGANWTFIFWGLIHGLLSCIDRACERVETKVFEPIRWFFTMLWVSVLWLLFSACSVGQWLEIMKRALLMRSITISDGVLNCFKIIESRFFYNILHLGKIPNNVRGFNMILFILVAGFVCLVPNNNYRSKDKFGIMSMIGTSVAFVWGILCLGSESVFVYFGF